MASLRYLVVPDLGQVALGVGSLPKALGLVMHRLSINYEFQKGINCTLDSKIKLVITTPSIHKNSRCVICCLVSGPAGEDRDVICSSGSRFGDRTWKCEHIGRLPEWPLAKMQVSVKYKDWMVSVLDFCFCITSVSIPHSGTFGNNFEADPFILAVRESRDVLEKNNFVKPGRLSLYSSVCSIFKYYFINCSLF